MTPVSGNLERSLFTKRGLTEGDEGAVLTRGSERGEALKQLGRRGEIKKIPERQGATETITGKTLRRERMDSLQVDGLVQL